MKKRNRILSFLLTLVTLISVMSLGALPVEAVDAYPYPGTYDPPEEYYRICHVCDGKYLAAEKINGQTKFSVGEKGDIFKFEKKTFSDTPGVYAFKILVEKSSVASSGVCLKVYGVPGYPTDGTEIVDAYGSNLWHEYWAFEEDGNGNFYIRSYLDNIDNTEPDNSGRSGGAVGVHPCMDIVNGSACTWHKDTGRESQLWKLENVKDSNPSSFKGEGTSEKPYEISGPEQLAEISDLVSYGFDSAGIHFKLTSSFSYDGSPIGTENNPFRGIFDGAGNTITAHINGGSNNSVGLFSWLSSAVVKNLEVSGSVKGAGSVGAIAGFADCNSVIDNCHVSAEINGTDANVGGIVGAMDTSTVSNCRMDGSVTSSGWTSFGGIVGGILNNGKIINCVNTGKVTGEKAVGGILGCVLYGDPVIVNCASIGSTAESEQGGFEHGGIVGFIGKDVHSMAIKGCFTNCFIGASTDSGYIIGNHEKTDDINCESVYYIPSGNSSELLNIVGTGNPLDLQIDRNIMMTGDGAKLVVTMNILNTYTDGKTESGVTLTTWEKDQRGIFPKSFQKTVNATGYTLSDGNPWIIIAGTVFILGGIAAIVISKKKKKVTE